MTQSNAINFGLAQINFHVGDIQGNLTKILNAMAWHKQNNADLVVFSELALCGYSPEDLMYRDDFNLQILQSIEHIKSKTAELNIAVVLGAPLKDLNQQIDPSSHQPVLYNSLLFIVNGEIKLTYNKRTLPNYSVFDEKRYFTAGHDNGVIEYKGIQLGFLICEDIWLAENVKNTVDAGAQILISIHGSPYYLNKSMVRHSLAESLCRDFKVPLIYVNQVGGQDELIFDGHSFACNRHGELTQCLEAFKESHVIINSNSLLSSSHSVKTAHDVPDISPAESFKIRGLTHDELQSLYDALTLATKDYVTKNGFKGIILGLSGGIDSALTLAIAVNALGADACRAVMMPFKYTSDISIIDAKEEADLLGVKFDIVPIASMFDSFMQELNKVFDNTDKDTTEENLQARCRGIILMALSNKEKRLVLTTSNKSEVAVGYSTLYGDMAGGFNVLKDLPKTWVYALSEYINLQNQIIPERVITRPPSAELAPDQTDEDNLPPYEILDPLIKAYVEEDASVNELLNQGFKMADIQRVLRLVNFNQYKRAQSPIGPKLTKRSFSKDRRYPVTNKFNPFYEV